MQSTVLDSIVLYGVFIFGEILIFLTVLHMLYQRRSPTSIISWLLLFIILPYFSLVLYFLIGMRKRPDKKNRPLIELEYCNTDDIKVDMIFRLNGVSGLSSDNSLELITDSTVAYDALIHEIRSAKESISFSTYVFKNDKTTREILKELTKRVKEGVNVRIIIDSIGSYRLYFFQGCLKELRNAGGEVRFFMPLFRLPYQNYINLRNHRKIYLFDESTLMTGGMNLESRYISSEKSTKQWIDILFKTQGYATYQYAQIFEADWAYANDTEIKKIKKPSQKIYGDTHIKVMPSGPDIDGDPLYEFLVSAIYNVDRRVWIVTPYFIPDESIIRALIMAKRRGVDVRLITPKKSNHLIADLSRSSYMRELIDNDIELVLHKGKMLHAKAILFDDKAVMLGSVNIDNRSLLVNYEVASLVYSKSLITEVQEWMQTLMSNSDTSMSEAGRLRRILENLMRIFAPQL